MNCIAIIPVLVTLTIKGMFLFLFAWLPVFVMLKMVCVLIVQLPIHVVNRAPEETINRKSGGGNKSERKR